MPENNDYLSQLMARVNERLNESDPGSGKTAGAERQSDDGPVKPHVFTTGGRFDDVPASNEEEEKTPPVQTQTQQTQKTTRQQLEDKLKDELKKGLQKGLGGLFK